MTPPAGTGLSIEFAALAGLESEAETLLAASAAELHAVRERVSRWSAAQQIRHALGVGVAVFADLDAALAGRPRRTTDAGLTEGGARVLAAGAFPRGVAEAPSAFRPEPEPPLGEIRGLLRDHAAARERLAAAEGAIAAATVRLPHFALGGLTLSEWVRFCRIHLAHHLVIARECLAASG